MTVADIVKITTFSSQPEPIDVPSPDGGLHAVVVQRGDVERNTNVYSLLVFRTDALFGQAAPDTVLTLASSSNRPAISHVKWLSDNHTLAFLGERPGESPQVYTVDVRTRQLPPRTHHATEITGYDIASSGDVIVYAAKPLLDTSSYAPMREHGFAVRSSMSVVDVLQGTWAGAVSNFLSNRPPQVLIAHAGGREPIAARVPGPYFRWCNSGSFSVAPGGRVALLRCWRERTPESWQAYKEPDVASLLAAGVVVPEVAILDLDRGTVEPLLDAPVGDATFQWSPTGESVVFANAFLPLGGVDSAERRTRAARLGIAEVDVRTRRLTVVAHRDSLDVVAWDAATDIVDFVPGAEGRGRPTAPRVRYHKTARGWVEVRGGSAASQPVLVVEEGLNAPPQLIAVDRSANRRAVLLDPNPQLARLRLGHEDIVRWRTRSGRERVGGLYLPPDFVSGHRYPLVIQTHGFDSTAFRPDGTFPTANAAQPMAAQGMLVLQIGAWLDPTIRRDWLTAREASDVMEEIEGAIDHLDSLGFVDRTRVGLIGFSRTCFYVLYTLTHSHHPIAAAAVTDGVDFSYLQYMLIFNPALRSSPLADESSAINGGPPIGANLDTWRERAPGFNLDRVTAPLRLEAIGLPSVLSEWEPYAGLLVQHKPVELFVIPDGTHILVKPWDRMASSQANADWFRFWLKGEEDSDSAKAPQYARWRELRKLQQQTARDTSATRQ